MIGDEKRKLSIDEGQVTVVPLMEEELQVDKREVVSGRVRIRVATDSIEQAVAHDLRGEEIDVERVPVGTYVESGAAAPQLRTEGDTTIVPILEEVLVVEKRLLLKEELHIRRRTTTERTEIPVTLRRQRAEIERVPVGNDDPSTKTNPKE
jgi:uncharacterized protein (TIGR02271 family)